MLTSFDKILLFKKVSLFAEISIKNLQLLANISEEILFKAGTIIIQSGKIERKLYIIEKGKIKVLKDRGLKISLKTPSYFGERAILSNYRCIETIEALENTNLIVIDGEKFRQLLNSQIIFPIIRNMFDKLVNKTNK